MRRVEYAENSWICASGDHPECHFTVVSYQEIKVDGKTIVAQGYIEDPDGAPYPEVTALYQPDHEPPLYIPYPMGYPTAGPEIVQAHIDRNPFRGWKSVQCMLVPLDPMAPVLGEDGPDGGPWGEAAEFTPAPPFVDPQKDEDLPTPDEALRLGWTV